MKATFRPLTWVGPITAHRRSRWVFKAPWQDTLDLLESELAWLDAENIVIEADFRDSDIRLDGLPKSNARVPDHPGVRVAFDSIHGPLIYQTDTCEFWQHNVRSIALGLQALRAVDRYGITKRAEQYQGYKAIGSGATPMPATHFRSADQAERWLRSTTLDLEGEPIGVGPPLRNVLRLAARQHHPDTGGTEWDKFEQAKRLVEAG